MATREQNILEHWFLAQVRDCKDQHALAFLEALIAAYGNGEFLRDAAAAQTFVGFISEMNDKEWVCLPLTGKRLWEHIASGWINAETDEIAAIYAHALLYSSRGGVDAILRSTMQTISDQQLQRLQKLIALALPDHPWLCHPTIELVGHAWLRHAKTADIIRAFQNL